MHSMLFPVLLSWIFAFQGGERVTGGDQITERVIVVQLDVQYPNQVDKCYTTSFDKKKIELNVEFDDTIVFLQDFIFEEDPIEGPGCFIPQLKLIYKDYTYVVSLYCTSVLKYRNSAPFTPSSNKLPNDLEITESVLDYLKTIHKKYFGASPNPGTAVCQRFIKSTPVSLADRDDDISEDEEEDEDDTELEKDLIDNQEMFDAVEDPDDQLLIVDPDDEH